MTCGVSAEKGGPCTRPIHHEGDHLHYSAPPNFLILVLAQNWRDYHVPWTIVAQVDTKEAAWLIADGYNLNGDVAYVLPVEGAARWRNGEGTGDS